jgi:hypothetical protein
MGHDEFVDIRVIEFEQRETTQRDSSHSTVRQRHPRNINQ